MFTIELHQIKVNTYVIWVTRLQNKARYNGARFVLYKETSCVSFRQSVATRNLFVAFRYFAMLRRVVKGFARKMTPRGA